MKIHWTFLLLLTGIITINACKKDADVIVTPTPTPTHHFDTLFPLSYFPAYPASFWRYINSANDTVICKTDSSYKLDSYVYWGNPSDTFYVPYYNNVPIWGYQSHSGSQYNHFGPMWTLLSEGAVGTNWQLYFDNGNGSARMVVAKDSSVYVNGVYYYPTIVIKQYPYPPLMGGPNHWNGMTYYTKDIGMVKQDTWNPSDSTITTLMLYDYHINH